MRYNPSFGFAKALRLGPLFSHIPVFVRLSSISLVMSVLARLRCANSTPAKHKNVSVWEPQFGTFLRCWEEITTWMRKRAKSHFFLDTDNLASSLDFSLDTLDRVLFKIKHLILFMLITITNIFLILQFYFKSSADILFSYICLLHCGHTDMGRLLRMSVCFWGPQPSVKGFWGESSDDYGVSRQIWQPVELEHFTRGSHTNVHKADRALSQRLKCPLLKAWELCIISALWQYSVCLC